MTPRGINQREADVAQSFARAVDKVIERTPDIVLVGGDVFHQVRPPNTAIVQAYIQFGRMRAALPNTEIVMVAGNHDTPRSTDMGSILRLFSSLGIHVVDAEPKALDFPELDLSVLAIAHNHHPRPLMKPSSSRRYNLLVLHGEAVGEYEDFARPPELAAREIPAEDFFASEWDYIALGHYHVYKQLEPNKFYSGATDYTSSNVWSEKAEEKERGIKGKRIIERDLDTGTHIFHDLPESRSFIDLPPISARGLTTEEVNEQIVDIVSRAKGGIDDKVVRLVVRDLPRHVARQLDHRQLREFRKRALHFQLDTHRPDVIRSSSQGAPGRRATLEELVRDKLRERVLPPDVEREALVDLGVQYLRDATVRESQTTAMDMSADI
ncbi:MAG: Calcineurin-like phosphoesterase superfamily domain protein [Gemmatimonadetes bacterium]|nr:Calcineurin-like phosphoesterase superfamily domain protein [Gemmatimonadota bacterium]